MLIMIRLIIMFKMVSWYCLAVLTSY